MNVTNTSVRLETNRPETNYQEPSHRMNASSGLNDELKGDQDSALYESP